MRVISLSGTSTEMTELSGGSIELCQPKAQRLVLRVKPRCHGNGQLSDAGMNHFFLGFSTTWERNLWFCWLKEVSFYYRYRTVPIIYFLLVMDGNVEHFIYLTAFM